MAAVSVAFTWVDLMSWPQITCFLRFLSSPCTVSASRPASLTVHLIQIKHNASSVFHEEFVSQQRLHAATSPHLHRHPLTAESVRRLSSGLCVCVCVQSAALCSHCAEFPVSVHVFHEMRCSHSSRSASAPFPAITRIGRQFLSGVPSWGT